MRSDQTTWWTTGRKGESFVSNIIYKSKRHFLFAAPFVLLFLCHYKLRLARMYGQTDHYNPSCCCPRARTCTRRLTLYFTPPLDSIVPFIHFTERGELKVSVASIFFAIILRPRSLHSKAKNYQQNGGLLK